ncbi:hypothetical protein [Lysobacter sp. M2-1]|uniref:hypothetical protein n=1 Tax=Lysobacter sp. M2-1 TaxID=2916839 RepID=UPI001F59BDEC|nr:hypothetical protein [Lysobacter sp. M2-1]
MKNAAAATSRRALTVFLLAIAGSVTGLLAGPRIVAAFQGSPAWMLPAILCASVLLALVATYMAFNFATRSKRHPPSGQDGVV